MVHHEHEHDEEVPETQQQLSPENLLPMSIIVAALIIAGSLLYTGKTIKTALVGGGTVVAGTQQNAAPAQPTGGSPAQPSGPVNIADRNGEPVLGNKNAKVTMVEFADFQCPYCKNFFQQTFSQLKSKYIDTGKVKFVYRYFPLTSIHVNAEISAEAGECANLQGKFWAYHDIMFTKGQADGTGLDSASLKQYAQEAGLNTSQFNSCLDNAQAKATVTADTSAGSAAGVSGTPSFFINGKMIVGAQPEANFEQAIEAALK